MEDIAHKAYGHRARVGSDNRAPTSEDAVREPIVPLSGEADGWRGARVIRRRPHAKNGCNACEKQEEVRVAPQRSDMGAAPPAGPSARSPRSPVRSCVGGAPAVARWRTGGIRRPRGIDVPTWLARIPARRVAQLSGLAFIPGGLVKFVFHAWELKAFRDFGIPAATIMEPIVGVLETLGGLLFLRGVLILTKVRPSPPASTPHDSPPSPAGNPKRASASY